MSSGAELEHKHTSDLLDDLVRQAPEGMVNLDWLLGHLDKRSFGLARSSMILCASRE